MAVVFAVCTQIICLLLVLLGCGGIKTDPDAAITTDTSVNDDSLKNNTNTTPAEAADENTIQSTTQAPRGAPSSSQSTTSSTSGLLTQGHPDGKPDQGKVSQPDQGIVSKPDQVSSSHLEFTTSTSTQLTTTQHPDEKLNQGNVATDVTQTTYTPPPNKGNVVSKSPQKTSVPPKGTQKPHLEYLVFKNHTPTPMVKTQEHTHLSVHFTAKELDAYDHHLVIWVSILGVGCFLLGIVFTSLVAFILYRRQRRKWRGVYKRRYSRPRAIPVYDVESWQPAPHNHTNQHPVKFPDTVSPNSDFSRFKEDLMQNDMRTLFASHVPTSLAEEDPHNNLHRYEYQQSVFPQLTTYSGELCPFANQFSRIISSEGGEISSPYSDVAVFLAPRAIRKGTSRQVFVNVAIQGDVFLKEFLKSRDDSSKLSINLKDLALENLNRNLVQLSPVVECISPGVQRFARPVAIRIPHRANVNSGVSAQGWELRVVFSSSPLGEDMSWETLPNEDTVKGDQTPDAMFSSDQDSVYVRTYLPGTWAVLGRPKGKHSALRLCAVAYAQSRLPSCAPSSQGLQLLNCDNNANQSSFPDLIVPTTSQTHCDSEPGPSFSHGFSTRRDFQPHYGGYSGAPPSVDTPQQVRLSVYVADPYIDAHKRICEIEATRGSKCQSHHQSLSVYNRKDWEVTLVSTHDPSWSWTLPHGEAHTKTLSMEACMRCSAAAPPSVDFSLEYQGRKGQESASGVQATFSLVQKRKDRNKMVDTYLTTYHIPLPEYAPDDMDSLYRRLSDHSIHDTDSTASGVSCSSA